MKNTTWDKRWSNSEETQVATRVKDGITEVKYPNCGDIFRSDELDEMWCQDMFLHEVINEG